MGSDNNTHSNGTPELTPVFNEPTEPAPTPALQPWSKIERDQLEGRIARPELELKLTPGGRVEQDVNREVDNANRSRLAYINQMMEQRQGQARDEFNRRADGPER